MQTSHQFILGDARDLASIEDEQVQLVVTSPPYPMISMWDEAFRQMSPEAGAALDREAGLEAFEAMHVELDRTWQECFRVLSPGGFACINIGDATRTLGGDFRLFHNHARILTAMSQIGF
ncbi:MAG: DNA methyltransferase, partial [Myxococcota bacterium]|nr:DNA methyltransferase [Myxococcota bacterium]